MAVRFEFALIQGNAFYVLFILRLKVNCTSLVFTLKLIQFLEGLGMKFKWGILVLVSTIVSISAFSGKQKRVHVNKYAHLACKKSFTPPTEFKEVISSKAKESDLIYAEYGIETKYPDEVIRQAGKLLRKGIEPRHLKNRIDFTKEKWITIDGKETIDRDDAISVTRMKNGNYTLRVSVPDMAAFISPDSAIGKWIFNQTTSHYLRDQVIHMLPPKLVSGLLSIDPGVNRLAFVYSLEYSIKEKKFISFQTQRGLVRSRKAISYEEFQEKMDNPELQEKHEKHAIDLFKLVAEHKDPSINFPFNIEKKAKFDENGKVSGFDPLGKVDANYLIEVFMVAINEMGAKYMDRKNIPGIFRTQEEVSPEKVEKFYKVIKKLGYGVNYVEKLSALENLRIAFRKIRTYENPEVIMPLLYFLTNPAENTIYPGQHYFLNVARYAFLTSPLRRVSDYWNQMMFGFYLDGKLESPAVFDLLSKQDVLVSKDNENISNSKKAEVQWQNTIEIKLSDIQQGLGYQGIVTREYKTHDQVYLPEKKIYVQIERESDKGPRDAFAMTGKRVFIQVSYIDYATGTVFAVYR